MPAKVLLISANTCAAPYPVFPLGLGCLHTALARQGHAVEWFDWMADAGTADLAAAVRRFQPDCVGISLRNIDDVLIRRQETYYQTLPAMVEAIRRETRSPVILGGSGFSIFPERLLALSGADYGLVGEAEQSFPALLAALGQGREVAGISGLVHRSDATIQTTPRYPCLAGGVSGTDPELYPSRVLDYYLKSSSVLSVQTQRGCAHQCCYCTYPIIEGWGHRYQDPEAVADQFAALERRGARYVVVVDSIFNSSAEHVTRVCEALLRQSLKLKWGCFLRPQGVTRELAQLMARAGLAHAELGSDSFSDSVLAAYNKQFTFADILATGKTLRQAGIDGCHFLISGGPGETAGTLRESFENSRHLEGAVVISVVGMRIYPGTALYQRALNEGVILPDTDILPPTYYLAPGLTKEAVFETLQAFARQMPNWIVGDPPETYLRAAEKLRSRGVIGPLWSYFAMMQRVLPGSRSPGPA